MTLMTAMSSKKAPVSFRELPKPARSRATPKETPMKGGAGKAMGVSGAPTPKQVLIIPLAPEKCGHRKAAGEQAFHAGQTAAQEHSATLQGLAGGAALTPLPQYDFRRGLSFRLLRRLTQNGYERYRLP